jgi:hypothetical protein
LPSARAGTRQNIFFFIFDGVGGLGREVTLFLPSARNSVALGKATLCRVQHSAKSRFAE